MLNSGEVPNLFAADEYEQILQMTRPKAKDAGISEQDRYYMLECNKSYIYFTCKCHKNLLLFKNAHNSKIICQKQLKLFT